MWIWCQRLYAILTLLILASGAGLYYYWEFLQDDEIITKINKDSMPHEMVVKAGESIVIRREFCLKYSTTGWVTRNFTNHLIYQLPPTSLSTSVGCAQRAYLIEIPDGLFTGEYVYNTEVTFRLNPLKTVVYKFPPIKLKVINEVLKK